MIVWLFSQQVFAVISSVPQFTDKVPINSLLNIDVNESTAEKTYNKQGNCHGEHDNSSDLNPSQNCFNNCDCCIGGCPSMLNDQSKLGPQNTALQFIDAYSFSLQ